MNEEEQISEEMPEDLGLKIGTPREVLRNLRKRKGISRGTP